MAIDHEFSKRGRSQRTYESPQVHGVRGKAPVVGLGDEISQKLKQNVKVVYNF